MDTEALLRQLERGTDALEQAVTADDWDPVDKYMRLRQEALDGIAILYPDPRLAPPSVRERLRAVGHRDQGLREKILVARREARDGAVRHRPRSKVAYRESSFEAATLLSRRA